MSTHAPDSPAALGLQGPAARYVLRDLSGIAEIEALLLAAEGHPNPLWAPDRERAMSLIEPTSRRLFGITENETLYVDDPALDEDENDERSDLWDELIRLLAWNDPCNVPDAWEKLGWNVCDASGRPLRSLEFFVRQIVTVTMGMAGRLPDADVELTMREEQDLEARLKAEVDQHRRTARSGSGRP
jgi:hypothetical protein